jgi:hypothetical protein
MDKFPTSPDGTDWSIFGDTPAEQWHGMIQDAEIEDIERETGLPAWYSLGAVGKTLTP